MTKSIEIQNYMTICPHSVGVDQPAKVAIEMMRNQGFRHLPVQSGGKLVGVVSERDIQFALAYSESDDSTLKIDDIFTVEPYVVAPETSLKEVAQRMGQDKIGCALIVAGEKLVGIFTTTDACRVLAETI